MPMTHHTHHESGFTMVVIAALFVALAVIAAVAVERNTTIQLITRRDAANAQLTRLSNAIIEYAVFNKSSTNLMYPCPARLDLPTSDANFGLSVTDCWNTGLDPITGVALLGAPIIRGMVPVQTLSQYGIGINDAFDPWDNRIFYVVNRNTAKGAAFAQSLTITISDPRTTTTFPSPDFALISVGRDGVGGIKRGSITASIPCTAASTIYRLENCDADTTFLATPSYIATGADGTAVAINNRVYFDDIITYYRQ